MARLSPSSLAGGLLLVLAGCTGSSSDTYRPQDVGRVMETTPGRVLASREVKISGTSSGLGTVAGGVSGAFIGSSVGSKSGNTTGAVIGALAGIAGAALGYAAEELLTSRSGVEYTIETTDGRVLTVAQNRSSGEPMLPPGTPVVVQMGGSYSRVVPDQTAALPPAGAPSAAGRPASPSYEPPTAATTPRGGEASEPLYSPSPVPEARPSATAGRPSRRAEAAGGGGDARDWVNPDTVPVGRGAAGGATTGGTSAPPVTTGAPAY
jgi:outer membrane lipoprotein SlyB